MKPRFRGTEVPVSGWRLAIALIAAVGVIVLVLPGTVRAAITRQFVTIVDPIDDTAQANVLVEPDGKAELRVTESHIPGFEGGPFIFTHLLTPAAPVAVLVSCDAAADFCPADQQVTTLFGVATPDTKSPAYVRFLHIKSSAGDGDPPCTSPAWLSVESGTGETKVSEFGTMWIPAKGQTQEEFPIFGVQTGLGQAGALPETHCIVAWLMSGGPVKASVVGAFD